VTIEGVDFILDLRDIPNGDSATSSFIDLVRPCICAVCVCVCVCARARWWWLADLWFATGQDIKEADGVMIMYSVASTASLQEAVQMKGYVTRKRFEREMEQTESNASIIPLILVGVDHGIKKREIPWEDGTANAHTHTHTHTHEEWAQRSTVVQARRWHSAGSVRSPRLRGTRPRSAKASRSWSRRSTGTAAPSIYLRCSLHPGLP
jgi:hypothetical protein